MPCALCYNYTNHSQLYMPVCVLLPTEPMLLVGRGQIAPQIQASVLLLQSLVHVGGARVMLS